MWCAGSEIVVAEEEFVVALARCKLAASRFLTPAAADEVDEDCEGEEEGEGRGCGYACYYFWAEGW